MNLLVHDRNRAHKHMDRENNRQKLASGDASSAGGASSVGDVSAGCSSAGTAVAWSV